VDLGVAYFQTHAFIIWYRIIQNLPSKIQKDSWYFTPRVHLEFGIFFAMQKYATSWCHLHLVWGFPAMFDYRHEVWIFLVAEHAQSSASGIIWVGFKAFCLPQIEQVHQVIIGYRLSNRPYYQWIGSREKLQEIMGFYHEKSWVFRLKFSPKAIHWQDDWGLHSIP